MTKGDTQQDKKNLAILSNDCYCLLIVLLTIISKDALLYIHNFLEQQNKFTPNEFFLKIKKEQRYLRGKSILLIRLINYIHIILVFSLATTGIVSEL